MDWCIAKNTICLKLSTRKQITIAYVCMWCSICFHSKIHKKNYWVWVFNPYLMTSLIYMRLQYIHIYTFIHKHAYIRIHKNTFAQLVAPYCWDSLIFMVNHFDLNCARHLVIYFVSDCVCATGFRWFFFFSWKLTFDVFA